MKYQIGYTPRPGFSSLAKPGDAGMKYLGFGMACLKAGQKYSVAGTANETALVLLKGTVAVFGANLSRTVLGPRKCFFTEKPWTVVFPANEGCEIEAVEDCEVAICQSKSTARGSVTVIPPDKVKDMTLGKGNYTRRALIMVNEDVPAEFLFIGEAIVPPGNWASYPPHRHEKDDLPHEVEMEEVYYFRFDKPQGFGIQKIYTDDRSIDETLTIKDHDTVLIPRGYHPVIAAPGYTLYYLWIMAGKNRKFLSRIDPDHSWILKS